MSKASDYVQEIKLLKQQSETLLRNVKRVVEKDSFEFSLEDILCGIVAGDNDHLILRNVFYGKSKRSRHCCRKITKAEQCVGTL